MSFKYGEVCRAESLQGGLLAGHLVVYTCLALLLPGRHLSALPLIFAWVNLSFCKQCGYAKSSSALEVKGVKRKILLIGDVAKRAGLKTSAIRYYESEAL